MLESLDGVILQLSHLLTSSTNGESIVLLTFVEVESHVTGKSKLDWVVEANLITKRRTITYEF